MKYFRYLIAVLFLASIQSTSVLASSGRVAIIMPDTQNRTTSVFYQIQSGITSTLEIDSNVLLLDQALNKQDINDWLNKEQYIAIIALGQQAFSHLSELDISIPIIYGAAKLTPLDIKADQSAISTTYDSSVVINNLITLAGNIKRLHVVYSQTDNGWLIELAEKEADKHGIQLIKYESENTKSSSLYYRTLLEMELNKDDAIWLLNDKTVSLKAFLPALLKEAWSELFVLFSNSPAHVKNGVLFSTYPDMNAIGVRLANMTIEVLKDPSKNHLEPIKDLDLAINTRTADHLHIDYKPMFESFKIVFPSQQ